MSEYSKEQHEVLDLLKKAPGKRPQFFDTGGVDHLLTMIMELSSQLWIVKEKLYLHGEILCELDPDLKQKLKHWQPSPDQSIELEQMRTRMINNLFRSVTSNEPVNDNASDTDDPVPPGT
ncbi:hypothetical protein [uncultured Parasphingorhabdus sp.]|uniref:hypothetical protein n=1 Tax=uncultured Parasphingorhabdus sp. TaxID=2709694 RepID=UPI0030D7B6F6|tara:strand:+ start:8423 stop:8782 length:360 start_codon:yes stop_codon:yes gene_type:complete